MNIVAHWEAELAAGVNGQDRQLSGTWVMDGLYFAACYETNARELEAEADRCFRSGDPLDGAIWRQAAHEERGKAMSALASMLDAVA